MEKYLISSLLLSLLTVSVFVDAQSDERPNFLLIVTDDMGYTDLGAFGGYEIPTPNLDRLAWNGVRLTNFHAAPSCGPTRAMLMSGTGNHEAGLGSQLFNQLFDGEYGYEGFLQPRVATMPEVLQESGYNTMMSGKWHIGERDPSGRTLPSVYGFSRDYTLLRGADNHYGTIRDATYSEDGRVHRLTDLTYSTIRYTDKLLGFLEDHKGSDDPFFAVYAPTAPHWPLHYPPGWEERFTGAFDAGFDELCSERMAGALNENILPANASTQSCNKEAEPWNALPTQEQQSFIKAMEIYAAMVAHLDEDIGRILETLEQQGKMDNTWIIFMNDNGPQGGALDARLIGGRETSPMNNSLANLGKPDSWASVGQGWADASSSPYRNTKGSPYEGGMRVPAFIWHGSAVTSGSIDHQFLTLMDIMPTVLDIADIDPPQGNFKGRNVLPIRGKSMVPLLASTQTRIHDADEAIALDHSGNRMMVKGDWKIVQLPRQEWQLFNMIEDPMESRDMASQMPDLLADMMAEFNGFAATRNYIEVTSEINQL
jgi:arylsulfatase A-like enzyme